MRGFDELAADPFWDIRKHEKDEEQQLREQIERTDRELSLAKRALNLRGAAGFDDFLKNIAALRASVARDMVGCVGSDSWLRVLQGKAQALGDVLGLLGQSETAVERLAAQRSRLQDQLNEVLRRRPKVRSEREVSEP